MRILHSKNRLFQRLFILRTIHYFQAVHFLPSFKSGRKVTFYDTRPFFPGKTTVDGAILERNDEFWISLVTFIGFGIWSGVTFFLNDHILQLFLYSKFWNKEYLGPSWLSGPEGIFEASSGHFFVSLTIVGHYVRKIICRTQITLKCPAIWLHFFCSCHSLLEPVKDRSIIIPSFSMFHKANFSKISELWKLAKVFLDWFTIFSKNQRFEIKILFLMKINQSEKLTCQQRTFILAIIISFENNHFHRPNKNDNFDSFGGFSQKDRIFLITSKNHYFWLRNQCNTNDRPVDRNWTFRESKRSINRILQGRKAKKLTVFLILTEN